MPQGKRPLLRAYQTRMNLHRTLGHFSSQGGRSEFEVGFEGISPKPVPESFRLAIFSEASASFRTCRAGYNCAHLRRFRGGLETAKEEGRSQSTDDLGSDEQRDINGPNPCKSVGERTCDCDCWVGERS